MYIRNNTFKLRNPLKWPKKISDMIDTKINKYIQITFILRTLVKLKITLKMNNSKILYFE